MFARMKNALERAVGKEWLSIERDVARRERIERQHERDVALWERDDYHRQLDMALGERDEYLRQRNALFEQLENERKRNRKRRSGLIPCGLRGGQHPRTPPNVPPQREQVQPT
jgi:hypothetical protein